MFQKKKNCLQPIAATPKIWFLKTLSILKTKRAAIKEVVLF
jgi:hypothetical protein